MKKNKMPDGETRKKRKETYVAPIFTHNESGYAHTHCAGCDFFIDRDNVGDYMKCAKLKHKVCDYIVWFCQKKKLKEKSGRQSELSLIYEVWSEMDSIANCCDLALDYYDKYLPVNLKIKLEEIIKEIEIVTKQLEKE